MSVWATGPFEVMGFYVCGVIWTCGVDLASFVANVTCDEAGSCAWESGSCVACETGILNDYDHVGACHYSGNALSFFLSNDYASFPLCLCLICLCLSHL